MFRLHPQTLRMRELCSEGAVGGVRQAVAEFGHRLDDPTDVRGIGALGGGSLGDVGCYCVSALRLAFDSEPHRVTGPRPSRGSTRKVPIKRLPVCSSLT
jgi:D-xylose 1-dehydrogenase (NADP+, D-xylono-1,5-lactone-forming)